MKLLKLYKKILEIRSFENKLDSLFKRGLVHGTAHFCVGQEFIPVIISQYLKKEDSVTSTHRGHGHAISKNLDIKKLLAELLGKKEGYNSGKGGSQHVISRENNFYANGITGGMIPVANGIAFANKYKKNKNIVVAYLGDGAFNEGYVLESLNLAAVLKLPILFVCENNLYAMSTNVKYSHSAEICSKVKSFGIKCGLIEQNNFKKLDCVAKEFISDIRKKSEPYFIEVRTYRHYGHSKNDLNLYRGKEEEKFWFEKDALKVIEKELIESGKMTLAKSDLIKKEYEQHINNISDEVIKSSVNDSDDVLKNLYAN